MPDNDNGFVLSHIIAFSTMNPPILTSLRLIVLSAVCSILAMSTHAWAYKVEKICEDIPATSKGPAEKKCKVVKVQEGAAAAKKDGKGDGKDGKGDAKKDAKPAGGH